MKIITLTTMMLLSGLMAYGESEAVASSRSVTVCLNSQTLPGVVTLPATDLTSKMFAAIGVALNWRISSRKCPADALLVEISMYTPRTQHPDSFAYAQPYEGKHIEVFYDRIKTLCPGSFAVSVLAHVMAHEITHMLEGLTRHSPQGILKSKWDRKDYAEMRRRPLTFSPEDVQLIYFGLAARQVRALRASGTEPGRALLAHR